MKIAVVLGTRPEIIKMAPIIDEIVKRDIDLTLIHTGQHYDKEMSDNFFRDLEIPAPDYNINVGSGSHGRQTGLMMQGIEEVSGDGLRGKKVLRNGRLLIIVGDKMYNAMGQEERP